MFIGEFFGSHFCPESDISVDRAVGKFVGGELRVNGEMRVSDLGEVDVDSSNKFDLVRSAFGDEV